MKYPQEGNVFPCRQSATIAPLNRKLNLSRAGFIFRGTNLFNQLPMELRTCKEISKFKKEVRDWTLANVDIKSS